MIREWKEYHGDKTFHIDGGQIKKGPLKRPRCKICNDDLEIIRKEDPKRRALHFCSIECYDEARELHKIWKKLKAEVLWWSPAKPPIDKRKLTYTIAGEGGIQHVYKGRKSRTKRNNTKK